MVDGKKIRIRVRTVNAIYVGDIIVPAMRNRVSDLFNDEKVTFINLTDVTIDNAVNNVDFVSLNKNHIESITIVD